VPDSGGRLAPGSVRDDTVSTDGPVPDTALKRLGDVHGVVLACMTDPGCAAVRGLAACNTNCPWRRGCPGEVVLL
jgi:Asp/Glu/hydantoin racemase